MHQKLPAMPAMGWALVKGRMASLGRGGSTGFHREVKHAEMGNERGGPPNWVTTAMRRSRNTVVIK